MGDLRANLFSSTVFMKTQIDDALLILMNPELYITFYNNNTTLITRDLWETRGSFYGVVVEEINEICSID